MAAVSTVAVFFIIPTSFHFTAGVTDKVSYLSFVAAICTDAVIQIILAFRNIAY